jgi:hypothetical protein
MNEPGQAELGWTVVLRHQPVRIVAGIAAYQSHVSRYHRGRRPLLGPRIAIAARLTRQDDPLSVTAA